MKWLLLCGLSGWVAGADLVPGDVVTLKLRGVQGGSEEVDGDYTVDELGMIRLPLLEKPLEAAARSPIAFARAAESAYRTAGIYQNPAIEAVAKKAVEAEGAVLSVGGHVRRSSQVPYRQGMTMIQAIDAVGGRTEFASRNVLLIRDGKQYCLDFEQLAHKNLKLLAGDSLQVEQKPAWLDRWKGTKEGVAKLLKEKGD
ncbi:protein involved in polysaccharide export with SLBB domain [Haloferula luteola]|uniref:Protein involved in polysaccharide export with SLBB domain n=1 Tax=Haloferula luteola TaxID=595692 RepID=A0A840VBI6_9BACT|nr:SLBB domain-containing protein [Haloferula luteola]MBB5351169.1 protein involved in polysaccharide export with SLBB domain [Haloferula luteola]